MSYDAILLVSFGGPEGRDDVIPFLENVLRGKPVPRERMLEVAEHYYHFDGVSPINEQNRKLLAALRRELDLHGMDLPLYWGNRNWHPLLTDTLQQMTRDGVGRTLALMTSAFSSYSGCRQYREDIEAARQLVGDGAPQVDKVRVYYNHPDFIEPMAKRVLRGIDRLSPSHRSNVMILFTAHSIPLSMAENCRYEQQLREACRLVAERTGNSSWELVYQSRSGSPHVPWLEPDICDYLRQSAGRIPAAVIVPIGFVSDHLEVLYDLDVEARNVCNELGIEMVRSETVGDDPQFVQMLRQLIQERLDPAVPRLALGNLGPSHDVCPIDCCLYQPQRPEIRLK